MGLLLSAHHIRISLTRLIRTLSPKGSASSILLAPHPTSAPAFGHFALVKLCSDRSSASQLFPLLLGHAETRLPHSNSPGSAGGSPAPGLNAAMYPYLQGGGPRMMGSFMGMPQSQQGGAGGFPFGGSGSNNSTGAASLASQLAGLSGQSGGQTQGQGQGGELNLSDFPALGAGQQGGQGQQGGAPGLGGLNNPLSSYATQAGTTGMSSNLRSGAPLRNFNQDDFPALNQSGTAEGRSGDDGFPHGVAEQVSAAAALQHQHQQREQHRQSLLGSVVGGARPDASLSAARGGFGEPDRNYATKLGAGPPAPGLGVQQQTWAPPGSVFGGNAGAGPNQLNGLQRSSSPSSARSPLSSVRNAASNLGASSPLTESGVARADGLQGVAGSNSTMGVAPTGAMAQTPAQQILTSPADRFGLLGLLSLIKSADPDLSMLSMGMDLQTFGLNLNSSDALHPSFITPWSENNMLASSRVEPEFTLPSCYNVQPPPPAQSKIASFSDETLFFIFYSTPRDVLQEVAAQELYARNWRYHKELHVWLTKEQGTEPTQKTPTYERGTYVFFDPALWEKVSKNFHLMYEMLEEKVPNQAQALAAQAAAQQAAAAAQAAAQQQQQSPSPASQQQQQQQPQQQQS
ncbi:not2 family protein [Moesziomyces antarcticus]|uniref:not2 family protein n=1 Tax=Pseudozyma antarctica TaxID=84753 RepID=UPI00071969DB|nr:not2 family protein [Moesziomyces antarcticus]GAK62136.1 not2 family protein [Moesziomyces antarcticus]